MNCPVCGREKVSWFRTIWYRLQKSSKKPTLTHLRSFSIGQTFTSRDWPFCSYLFKLTVPPLKAWLISSKKVSLLGKICYRLQKVPKSASRTSFDIFSVFSRNFSIDQAFTSNDWPFPSNLLKWTVPPLKGWLIS